MTAPSGQAPRPALAVTDPILTSFASDVGPEAAGPVAACGRRTRWSVGGRLTPGTREVTAPHGIVSYTPAEMTVKVRAGTAVAELDQVLAECGQRSPLPDRGGSVGGAVAVGENHLEVRGRGTVSAAVLQVRYVSAEGRLVTGGGPTVKNVTGFDLPRLLTGSLGTLGLLAEVVLRTNPSPEVSQWLEAEGADPFEASTCLLRPAAVLWDGWRTWVHLEGHRDDVAAEAGVLASLGDFTEVEGPPPLPPHRWSFRPSDLHEFRAADGRDGTDEEQPSGWFVASAGVGAVWADSPQPPRQPSSGVAALCRRMKDAFDPSGRLNPGREVGTAVWN